MLDLLTGASGDSKTQAGAFLSILDGFDRQIPRQTFYDILSRSIWLHTWLGSLTTFNSFVKLWEQDKMTKEAVESARLEFVTETEKMRAGLYTTMEQIAQLPASSSTIH